MKEAGIIRPWVVICLLSFGLGCIIALISLETPSNKDVFPKGYGRQPIRSFSIPLNRNDYRFDI